MGCILYELATGERAFLTDYSVFLYSSSRKYNDMVFDGSLDVHSTETITKHVVDMLQIESLARPSASVLSKEFTHECQLTQVDHPVSQQLNSVNGSITTLELSDDTKQIQPTPQNYQVVDSYVYKALRFQLLKATSSSAQHPSVSITAPKGTVILGGGSYVDWDGPCANSTTPYGNMITGMFPSDDGTAWTVSSKYHLQPSRARIVAYCIVAQMRDKTPIPKEYYKIVSETSEVVAHPMQQVNLPGGFSVMGGGARANYKDLGSMLYRSEPTPDLVGWVAAAKDHLESDPASITVWAIGLKNSFLEDAEMLSDLTVSSEKTIEAAHHPRLAIVNPDFQMTGGGGRMNWSGLGSLLTASFPQDRQTWVAEGKDHLQPDPSTITVYAVGFKTSY